MAKKNVKMKELSAEKIKKSTNLSMDNNCQQV
jgi:hypothetical protein